MLSGHTKNCPVLNVGVRATGTVYILIIILSLFLTKDMHIQGVCTKKPDQMPNIWHVEKDRGLADLASPEFGAHQSSDFHCF
jgi:hypothetical protein